MRMNFTTSAIAIGSITLVLGYFSYAALKENVLNVVKSRALLTTQVAVTKVDDWVHENKKIIKNITLSENVKTMNYNKAEKYLKNVANSEENISFIALIQKDGSYHNTKVGFAKGKNLKDRKHFIEAMKGNIYASEPVVSRTIKDLVIIAITAPIFKEGNNSKSPDGVLAGLINITSVIEEIKKIKYGEDSYAFAINLKGMPIVHPNHEIMGNTSKITESLLTHKDEEMRRLTKNMLSKNSSFENYRLAEGNSYVATYKLAESDWAVALVVPEKILDQEALFIDRFALVFMALFLISALTVYRSHGNEKRALETEKALSEASSAAKSEFIATMSHELRTPINAIVGNAEIISFQKNTSITTKISIENIKSAAEFLGNLIDAILTQSRDEVKNEVKLESIDSSLLIKDFRALLNSRAVKKGLKLNISNKINYEDRYFETDKIKLQQILINVATNSIKYTNEGSIDVEFWMELKENDILTLNVEIKDTGIGISEEDQKHIFEPFWQKQSNIGSARGVGLGLTIIQRLVNSLGGSLSLESQERVGTSVKISIPVIKSNDIPNQLINQGCENESEEENKIKGNFEFHEIVALIVDDDLDNLYVLENLLKNVGISTIAAQSAMEAILKLEENTSINIILSDIRMPNMDGFEMFLKIKEKINRNDIKFGFVTASYQNNEVEKSKEMGIKFFVKKPIDKSILYEEIKKIFPKNNITRLENDNEKIEHKEMVSNAGKNNLQKYKQYSSQDHLYVLEGIIKALEEGDFNVSKNIFQENDHMFEIKEKHDIIHYFESFESKKLINLLKSLKNGIE